MSMTTENDFQRALDAHPNDSHTDWCSRIGYRIVVILRRKDTVRWVFSGSSQEAFIFRGGTTQVSTEKMRPEKTFLPTGTRH